MQQDFELPKASSHQARASEIVDADTSASLQKGQTISFSW